MKPKVILPRASAKKLVRARQFRRQPTEAEALAWQLLRNRRMLGLKFKRQKVVYGFIADFYCAEHALVLELDGPIHQEYDALATDEARTRVFETLGISVVRITNEDLDPETLERHIHQATLTSPSPAAGEGE